MVKILFSSIHQFCLARGTAIQRLEKSRIIQQCIYLPEEKEENMPIRPLSKELAEKARMELNEDPKRIEGDIQHLKDWVAKQPHLRARTDDQWLVAFLRGSKYSLEKAKQKLDLYYAVRSTAPDMFRIKHRDPLFNEILDLQCLIILPETQGPDTPRVVIIRPGAYDPSKYQTADAMIVMNILQKMLLVEDDNSVVAGNQTLLDLDGVTMGHFMQMTPMLMKKMAIISQDATPIRMKGVHYINTPPGFEVVFNAIKALLNEKNRQRLYVHNKNYEELYKHIPKSILPAEYGGNAGTMKEITGYWKKKVQEYDSWLQDDLKYGTDESKRPGKPKTSEEMFGVEGSFRQLQFD